MSAAAVAISEAAVEQLLEEDVDWGEVVVRLEDLLGGELMTVEDFLDCVDTALFTDDDGYALPVVMNPLRCVALLPSVLDLLGAHNGHRRKRVRYSRGRLLSNCRYVVWFNR